jgi:hypothetical protein
MGDRTSLRSLAVQVGAQSVSQPPAPTGRAKPVMLYGTRKAPRVQTESSRNIALVMQHCSAPVGRAPTEHLINLSFQIERPPDSGTCFFDYHLVPAQSAPQGRKVSLASCHKH